VTHEEAKQELKKAQKALRDARRRGDWSTYKLQECVEYAMVKVYQAWEREGKRNGENDDGKL
jgi:hypothetical protein